MKLVDASEFAVSKRTVAATKLAEGDAVLGIDVTDAVAATDGSENIVSDQTVVLQTEEGFFIKFPLTDIPEKKKGAVGVRGMKLGTNDNVDEIFLIPDGADITITYKDKEVSLRKLKMSKRDGKGVKK